ncbi:MAG: TlpA disulfide reductase family protein [Gemmatimonadota bacterium]|nr:TlpA disulfide reductase family protein [Gemmatimonadota bacterium]
MNEYPETYEARSARNEFDPERTIRPGAPLPDFAFASLDDSTVVVSREALLGRPYLLDFWAVWCGPCIGELPNLHEVHERFSGEGFEIVSVSFDRKPEDVTEFRAKEKWKMPWLHVFAPGGLGGDVARTFAVQGIPRHILVRPDGTIFEAGSGLRGPRLGKKVAELLGHEPEAPEEESGG